MTTQQECRETVAVNPVGRVDIVVRSSQARSSGHSHLRAAGIILTITVLNLAYLLFACPLDLSPDEAHYWDWSRNLDWCYYSKGPLVAWLIRASCELVGTSVVAVRLPAVACNVLLLSGLYVLAYRTAGRPRIALVVAALAITVPPLSAGAVLMTIDAPFLSSWVWALVFAERAVLVGRQWAWPATGAVVALGVLAKYTMIAFPVCLAMYLIVDPARRRLLLSREFWIMVLIGMIGFLPIIGWNVAHDGIGLQHVFAQAGVVDGPKVGFHWLRPVEYIGSQFAFLGGYWFCVWLAATWSYLPRRHGDPAHAFLWWFSVPIFAACLVAGLRAKAQPNWSAAAYVTGFILAVAWVVRQFDSPSAAYRRLVAGCLAAGVGVGVAVSLVAHFPQLALPLFEAVLPPPSQADPAPIRKVDPTARLRGWSILASEIDRVRDQLRCEEGQEPLIAAMVWTIPGELGFYCQGHPRVYSFGSALSDRQSQYEIWRPNPIADPQAFRGRTVVYVGERMPDMDVMFDRIDPPQRLVYRENGIPVAAWTIWVGRGFRGFPGPLPPPRF